MPSVFMLAFLAHASDRDVSRDQATVLRERIAAFDAHATYPLPTLSDADLDRLVQGKLVKVREVSPDGPQRVTGLLIVEHARVGVFVSAADPHLAAVEEIHEVLVNPDAGYPRRWVQLLDLPRPFSDRYWVVDVRDNTAMHVATGGHSWEHYWTLAEDGPRIAEQAVAAGRVPGVDAAQLASSVYMPTNTGAFVYISLPGGRTLFGFHAKSVVGGRIPDGLVAQYTMATLGRMLSTVVERVPEACAHYDEAHAPILGGDGAPISRGCGG